MRLDGVNGLEMTELIPLEAAAQEEPRYAVFQQASPSLSAIEIAHRVIAVILTDVIDPSTSWSDRRPV